MDAAALLFSVFFSAEWLIKLTTTYSEVIFTTFQSVKPQIRNSFFLNILAYLQTLANQFSGAQI